MTLALLGSATGAMGQKFYGDLVLRPLPDGVHMETTCFATMMILGVLGAAVGNSSASTSLFRGPRTIRAGACQGSRRTQERNVDGERRGLPVSAIFFMELKPNGSCEGSL